MTESQAPEGETITLSKKEYDEMVEKLADRTQSVSNLTDEIKELREKRQISDAQAKELQEKLAARDKVPTGEFTPEKVVETAEEAARRILSERDKADAKANREAALRAFLGKHKEFHPDNDEGGLKFSAFERELSEFDLSGLRSVDEFTDKFEKARKLVVGTSQNLNDDGGDPNPPAPDGGGRPAPVKEVDNIALTPKELQIIDRSFDGDRDRYLKLKAKRPDYVETLLEYAR